MMVKRLFVVFLSLSLIIVPCLVVSVSAESSVDSIYDAQWMNIMPFLNNTTIIPRNGAGQYWVQIGGLPGQYYKYYDIVFRTDDSNPMVGTPSAWLGVYHIGGDMYRAYGFGGSGYSDVAEFYYYNHDASIYQTIAFNVSVGTELSYPLTGAMSDGSSVAVMPAPNSPASLVFAGTVSGSYQFDKEVFFTISDWNRYDFVDMYLTMRCTSVDSIVARMGNTAIPFTASVLNAEGDSWYEVSLNGSTNLANNNLRHFTYMIRLDLRNVDRNNTSDPPRLIINMSCAQNNGNNSITLMGVTGYLDTITLDTIPYLFQKLRVDLTGHFNTLGQSINVAVSTLANRIDIGLAALGNNITDNFIDLTSDLRGWFTTTFDKFDQLINPDAPETDQAIDNAQDNISSIEQIESDYAADLDSAVITGQVDKVQNYGNALVFCSSILSRSFANLGGYQIIYVMPVCIGIFLFVASRARPIHVPKQREAPKANDSSVLDNSSG